MFGSRWSIVRVLPGELYSLSAPRTDGSIEQFFVGLHSVLRSPLRRLLEGQPWVSLEFVARAGHISPLIWIPECEKRFVESQLRAAFPGVQLSRAVQGADAAGTFGVAELRLRFGNYLPIRTKFDAEPLSPLLWTLATVGRDHAVAVQVLVRPKPSGWQVGAHLEAQRLRDGRRSWTALLPGAPSQVTPSQFEKARAKAIEEKASALGFDCVLRVAAGADPPGAVREYLRAVAASFGPYDGANGFRVSCVALGERPRERFRRRAFPAFGSFTLTARELAALWHVPSEAPPQLEAAPSAKLPPPAAAGQGDRVLGVSSWADDRRLIGLSLADSRLHLHLLGPTGTGKTTALLNLAVQDIAAGRGVAVLDPKGDLVHGVLERIPRTRVGEVILISPEESEFSIGINALELARDDDPDLVAENALTIFKRIYERFWGMRTDDILKATLRTLLQRKQSTLAHIPLLLTDAAFRLEASQDLRDIGLDSFWDWFERLSESQRSEAIGPVLNKLRDFLVRPRLRRLLCQARSTVDLREVVDSGRILLADLSVGRWGQTASELIGSFLVARLWQAVLARAGTEQGLRREFFLYLDEFQHFQGIAGPFADALAQARSLGLSLTIANQHLGQLPRDLREAIGSNARSRAVFQCGADDAAYLSREFAPLDASALMSLRRFEMAIRLAIDGETSAPFTLRTLPAPTVTDGAVAADTREASLKSFGRRVDAVDRELEATLGRMPPEISPLGTGVSPRR